MTMYVWLRDLKHGVEFRIEGLFSFLRVDLLNDTGKFMLDIRLLLLVSDSYWEIFCKVRRPKHGG